MAEKEFETGTYMRENGDLQGLRVFVCEIPSNITVKSVYPEARTQEIESCTNFLVRAQKYYVWKLLAHTLKCTFNKDMQDINIRKNKNGKWVADGCYFSLSHTENVVVVAVSDKPVGVDIENADKHVIGGFARKVLNAEELLIYQEKLETERNRFLIEKWTQKESEFKRKDAYAFTPLTIGTEGVLSQIITLGGREFYLSVASENLEKLHLSIGETPAL